MMLSVLLTSRIPFHGSLDKASYYGALRQLQLQVGLWRKDTVPTQSATYTQGLL